MDGSDRTENTLTLNAYRYKFVLGSLVVEYERVRRRWCKESIKSSYCVRFLLSMSLNYFVRFFVRSVFRSFVRSGRMSIEHSIANVWEWGFITFFIFFSSLFNSYTHICLPVSFSAVSCAPFHTRLAYINLNSDEHFAATFYHAMQGFI